MVLPIRFNARLSALNSFGRILFIISNCSSSLSLRPLIRVEYIAQFFFTWEHSHRSPVLRPVSFRETWWPCRVYRPIRETRLGYWVDYLIIQQIKTIPVQVYLMIFVNHFELCRRTSNSINGRRNYEANLLTLYLVLPRDLPVLGHHMQCDTSDQNVFKSVHCTTQGT